MENLSEFIASFNANKAVANTALTRQDWIFNPEKVYSLNIENPIVIESTSDIPNSWYSENNTILTFPAGNEIVSNGTSANTLAKSTTRTVNGKLNNLINGSNMFKSSSSSLSSFESELPSLTNGTNMFYLCTKLTSFESELPNLTNGTYMFRQCSSLTSFESELPNLTNGSYMFNTCSSLTSWNVELPNLTRGDYMFNTCSSLTSFDSELPNLTNGSYMFQKCSNLTSFESELPNLTNGSYMFDKCKLDYESVERIVNSLPTSTSSTNITIGYDNTKITDAQKNSFNTTLVNKKWRVTWQAN